MNNVDTYHLPAVRCFNCNKPIGHLYEEYINLLSIMNINNVNLNKEVFDILNIKNACCREKLSMPEVFINVKPIDDLIADTKTVIEAPKLTQIKTTTITNEHKKIQNEEKSCIPVKFNVSCKKTKISDNLYISYATDICFIAQ